MATKVVFNACYGGFSLSQMAINLGKKLDPSLNWENYSYSKLSRHNKTLVAVVETLGERAGGERALLRIGEISSDKYRIDEYDGFESVETPADIDWIKI